MSFTLNQVERGTLISFRNLAREMRNPQPYKFALSELKGALNITIGLGQILVAPCFKLFKAERLYDVHIEAGKTALKQGIRDLTPAIALTAVVIIGVTAQKWAQN